MSGELSPTEHSILGILDARAGAPCSLEELVGQLPNLSWSELFQGVDGLSRRGAIRLSRHGFDYVLSAAGQPIGCASGF